MTSGSGLRRLCLAGARASAVRAPTIVGFLNALLWMARSGSRWRDLPRPLGRHEAVKRRYYRWIEMGVLDQILAALAREADLEWLMIDSTIVRAHQHAAGARRQKGGRMPRVLVAPAGARAPKSTPPAMRWEIRCA